MDETEINDLFWLFQFHIVRLKDEADAGSMDRPYEFQFHIVRLKGTIAIMRETLIYVSIPYSSIKSSMTAKLATSATDVSIPYSSIKSNSCPNGSKEGKSFNSI